MRLPSKRISIFCGATLIGLTYIHQAYALDISILTAAKNKNNSHAAATVPPIESIKTTPTSRATSLEQKITNHQATSNAFTINGQAINPACLALINSSLADLPYVYTINLDHCQNANATHVTLSSPTAFKSKDGSSYSYQVIGETTNHIFVVATYSSGGGSGNFQNVILLRLKQSYTLQWNRQSKAMEQKPYLALQYLGDIGGGDRNTGALYNLKVVGNKLIGEQNSDLNSAASQDHPSEKISIQINPMTD